MISMIRQLYAHMRWADEKAVAALRRALPPAASAASDPAAADIADALRIYAHVLGSENVWLARLQQQTPTLAVWPALTMEACADAARENADRFDSFIATLRDEDMQCRTSYTNSAGQHFTSSVGDILMHAAMHGSYHRGQVALLMRRSGAEPAPTDYISFVRGVPAAMTAVPQ